LGTALGGFAGAAFGFANVGAGGSGENKDIARSIDPEFVAITAGAVPISKPAKRASFAAVYAMLPIRCSMTIFILFAVGLRGCHWHGSQGCKGRQLERRLYRDTAALRFASTHFDFRDIDDPRKLTDAIEEEC